MTGNKVRIYDLAKELKLETKRLIEEVRREGYDVSVPSNTVPKDLADKIRNRYFPKKEAAPVRTIRVVKKAPRPAEEGGEEIHASVPPVASAPDEVLADEAPLEETGGTRSATVRLMKKPLPPAARAEHPLAGAALTGATPAPALAELSYPTPQLNEPATSAPGPVEVSAPTAPLTEQTGEAPLMPIPPSTPDVLPKPVPPANQIRVLRPTAAALDAGVKLGERAPVPTPTVPTPSERARRSGAGGGRDERGRGRGGRETVAFTGTPGESATPQTVYTPPADARRPRAGRSRRGGAPVGVRDAGKGRGRFDRDYVVPAKALTLEQRIAGSMSGGTGVATNEIKQVRLVEGSTVKELAEKMGIKPKDIVALLLQRGVFATINQALNSDVAVELGRRFGYEVSFVPFEEMVVEEEFEELIATDADDVELPRAPVVTVMGHVDHGKTSLLDGIRATDVAAGEAGGITQHIGAYSVQVQSPDNPNEMRRVVFLDTPGHEAFTLMRARGAKATDVVVLVVAADDGVMPQTIEAIEHARAAHVPIVVAINKIDRPDANTDRVKQGLATQGLQPVDWGGDTEMVAVSAKKRENIDTLLETILLTTDILDLKASPTRRAAGVVLEAKLDRGRGSVATVLVQQGTLRVHDPFIAGQVFGKVRAMFNDRGEIVTEAGPATPVEVLGLQGVPQAGDMFQVVADVSRAQGISEHRQQLARQSALLQTTKRGIEALGQKEIKELLVLVKADVQGSVEVLKSTLQKLSTEQVKVNVIRSGVDASGRIEHGGCHHRLQRAARSARRRTGQARTCGYTLALDHLQGRRRDTRGDDRHARQDRHGAHSGQGRSATDIQSTARRHDRGLHGD